jgi:CheY-like chemotaxis protein
MNAPTPQLFTLTVLVVDDDDDVRSIMARQLEQTGYHVLTARDGVEALTLVKQSGIEVDLVICDLLMPRLDGYELAARLARLANAPEVIFMSAFRSDIELQHPVLTKPFLLTDLTAAAERILQRRSRLVSENV